MVRIRESASILRRNEGQFRAMSKSLLSRELARVKYQHLHIDGFSWSEQFVGRNVDQVEQGVALFLVGGGAIVALWGTDTTGLDVHLTTTEDAESIDFPDVEANEIETDVSHISRWREVLGRPISTVGASWLATESGEEALWSFRLTFEGSGSRTIALGELRGEGVDESIEGSTDSLVVIHDESIARALPPFQASASAYGEDIAP